MTCRESESPMELLPQYDLLLSSKFFSLGAMHSTWKSDYPYFVRQRVSEVPGCLWTPESASSMLCLRLLSLTWHRVLCQLVISRELILLLTALSLACACLPCQCPLTCPFLLMIWCGLNFWPVQTGLRCSNPALLHAPTTNWVSSLKNDLLSFVVTHTHTWQRCYSKV